uniref:ATPase subunit 8 n=1 Tax=Protohalopteris sp. TaxID=2843287 RepID=A0A8F0K1A2_9PHAE|nr:ATPase subunit 8 [Protohalopteris sp.]
MPQFDILSFFNHALWFFAFFNCVYCVILIIGLFNLISLFKIRNTLL